LTSGIDSQSSSIIFQWITDLKLNINQQIHFIEYIIDLSIIKEKSIPDILNENQFRDILRNNRSNNPQKAKRLINLLRSSRFPALNRAEKWFKKKYDKLELSKRVKIIHPAFFEAPDYRLEILFRDGAELKSLIDSIANKSEIEKIVLPVGADE